MTEEELQDQQSGDVEEQDEQPEEQEKSLQEKLKEVVLVVQENRQDQVLILKQPSL